MNEDVFDGFNVNVFLDEDDDYLAHFVEMPNVSAFSDTPEGALRELSIALKEVKESYQKHHEPVPKAPARQEHETPVNIPIDPQLYRALAREASKSGMGLYAFVTQKLKSTISSVQERLEQ